jgi:hypothetical protein
MALHQGDTYRLLNSAGKEVILRGTMDFWPNYPSSHIFNLNGSINSSKVNEAFRFIKSENGNFLRIFLSADWILNNVANIVANLGTLLTLAENNGIYVLCVFAELIQGAGGYSNELPYEPYITDAGWTTAKFNQAHTALANILKNHPNALQEIWNEPMGMDDDAHYNAFWGGVPGTISAIRAAGFNGIIAVNGEVSFLPGYDKSGMVWAIEHPNIFGPNKGVMATFHAYYRWLGYPRDPVQLYQLWFIDGRIAEARTKGIPVMYDETGTIRDGNDDLAEQDEALTAALQMCTDNKLNFSVMDFSSPYGGEELLNNENTPFSASSWNSTGKILSDAWKKIVEEVNGTLTKTFSGKVSAQVASGETVSIVVTKPDATKDTLSAVTNNTGAYSVQKDYVAGNYSAIASISSDNEYAAATSSEEQFTVNLTIRTLTLAVT